MAINKVVYAGKTLIDISDSTVTADTLAEGVIAYNAAGERIVGTHKCSSGVTVTDDEVGNVIVTGLSITDDGSGNITISGGTAIDEDGNVIIGG